MSNDLKQNIVRYYNQCHIDYQNIWGINKNLSIHYGFYDRKHNTHDEALVNFNRVLARIARIKSNDKVLDCGCGIGGSTIWLAKNLKANITGININPMQIGIARQLIKENSIEQLANVINEDYMKTKFKPKTFNVIWGLESICYANNKKEFLKEAMRLLKEGGRIIIADGFLKKNLTRIEKKEMNIWLNGWAVPNLASVDEFKKYLKELKFKNIKFKEVKKNIMPSSKRLYYSSIIGYPFGMVFKWLGLRNEIQTNNMIGAYYQHTTLRKGLWTYGIFYAEKGK